MGIPTNIKTLLTGDVVEWARVEFKETWDPEASLKTICAFANDIDNWGMENTKYPKIKSLSIFKDNPQMYKK